MEELLKTACGSVHPLALLLRGGSVLRYHTEGLELRQTVADHTWRVMVIIHHLWPSASPELVTAALYHDVAEGLTGDIPAPVKRDPAVRAAVKNIESQFLAHIGVAEELQNTSIDYARLKVADYLDLIFTTRQLHGGRAKRIASNGLAYLGDWMAKLPKEEQERIRQLLESMRHEY